jgi:D-galactarolactone cycloisomerase
MARIRDIRLIPLSYRMPDVRAYGMARALTAERGCALLEVETEDGVVGIGEAWGPARATAGYLEAIKAAYVGRELYERELIWSDIICRRYHLGLQSQLTACASGINMAIYDALGKTLGLPLCKLLGGHGRDRIPVYASDGYLTGDPANQLPAQLERIDGQGFAATKFKIGLNPKSDEERVRLARRILGDGEHAQDRVLRHPLLRGAAAAARLSRLRDPGQPRTDPGGDRRGAIHGVGLRAPDRGAGSRCGAA